MFNLTVHVKRRPTLKSLAIFFVANIVILIRFKLCIVWAIQLCERYHSYSGL